jgi:hypothetical protein
MNPIARLPLALAVVGLMAACAVAPDESSGASAINTAPIASANDHTNGHAVGRAGSIGECCPHAR